MRKSLVIFLFFVFSSSYSFAGNNKITPEDVERFINIQFKNFRDTISQEEYEKLKKTGDAHKWAKEAKKRRETIKKEIDFQKRIDSRQIAMCAYEKKRTDECIAKVVRAVLTYPEKSKKKRPGDIFYVLDIIDNKHNPRGLHSSLFITRASYKEGEKNQKIYHVWSVKVAGMTLKVKKNLHVLH